ncbi:MAG TPA: nucleotidyl transferase AbiEii/AbiGii toxin family protein [Smithellaceae bacterium]|jgi:predicted nucleotidyltransferase component of viral defense system|nr:nucleotidyl transferase AbiEii/AbiGii toxin family protein [Smithellaceae bacterium]
MMDSIYFRQAELVLRVLPLVDREAAFALKGGTAINFFVRDFPRLSVDIDLVYLPVAEREESLRALCAALVRIAHEVETRIPGAKITPKRLKGADLWSGCSVRRGEATIKIEPNLVMRGSLFPPERRILTPKARSAFELSVECRTLAEPELYAGKFCAALDRQHPRDLFDVLLFFRQEILDDTLRKAFIVYLICNDRPLVELLNPGLIDTRPVFETEFRDMAFVAVTCEELEEARKTLIARIAQDLTLAERQFLLSVKEGKPQWDLLGLEGVQNLPAVQWKLLNIGRMAPAKHRQAVQKLRDYLGV